MKTPMLVAAVITCALVVPVVVSAQDTAAPAKPALSMPMDAHMSQMHTNMTLMQSQMDTIRATTNPQERQKLMQTHMQTMQESMAMMRDMMKHHQMMQERMGMMQTMMDQMLQHQQVMESMPAK